MRQILLDTETTGLSADEGHRIIEIGCVEMIDRQYTDNNFHFYLNPDRKIDAGAMAVHGITNEFLQDKPRFYEVADNFLAFIQDAELIIHNAPFDIGFLNAELERLQAENKKKYGKVSDYAIIFDTLTFARKRHPGVRNSLDALCKRYSINNGHRSLHGALLDAYLLGDVYLAMTGGQASLFSESSASSERKSRTDKQAQPKKEVVLPVILADTQELGAHRAYLNQINSAAGGACVWDKLE